MSWNGSGNPWVLARRLRESLKPIDRDLRKTLGSRKLSQSDGKFYVLLLTDTIAVSDTSRMSVTPSQFDLLSKLVDVTQVRHRVLAQNVANVNTPGYRRLDVRFEDSLTEQLSGKGASAATPVKPEVVEDQTTPARLDGNNVEIDMEMMRLNKNTLLGNTYLQLLTTKLGMMKRAINGRTA